MTFVRRRIEAVINLGQGKFGETLGDTIKLAGLRMDARKNTTTGDAMGDIYLRVYGLPLHMMNQLTTIGPIAGQLRGQNRIVLTAGDEGGAMSTIFDGTILNAWADLSGAPEAVFTITGYAGADDLLRPIPASTYKGSADVADIMRKLAGQMNLTFENSGVAVKLSNPYFPGTALTQVRSCARAAGINFLIDNGKLAIWPRGARRQGEIPVMSPKTGMIGYPTYTSAGITVSSVFMPGAQIGGHVKIESDLTPANGEWSVARIQHEIACYVPGGPWFTHLELTRMAS